MDEQPYEHKPDGDESDEQREQHQSLDLGTHSVGEKRGLLMQGAPPLH